MDRTTVRALREELGATLKSARVALSYEVEIGNATFNPSTGEATFKVNLRSKNAYSTKAREGEALREWERFEASSALSGKRGAKFKHGRREYTLTGHTRTGQLIAARDDGKEFRFPRSAVLLLMGLPHENPLSPAALREERRAEARAARREARAEAAWEARVS